MGLLTCSDCGREVSTEAASCPNCGRPMQPGAGSGTGSQLQVDPAMVCGVGGGILLFLGVFAPIVSAPVVGSVNYFRNGEGDGVVVALLAVLSVIFTLVGWHRWLWVTGGGALATLVFTFAMFRYRMGEMRREMQAEMEGNPFAGLGEAMMETVQLQWGWALLVVGAISVIAGAFLGTREGSQGNREARRV